MVEPRKVERERRSFRYSRSTPLVVNQGTAAICWAAALESWLDATTPAGTAEGVWTGDDAKRNRFDGTPWKRQKLDTEQIVKRWSDLTNSDGSLKAENMPTIAIEVGMTGSVFPASRLREESLRQKLHESHLYVLYFSAMMNHAIVAYGYDTAEGILVMDPAPSKGLITRPFSFFQEPQRVNRMMFVGWEA